MPRLLDDGNPIFLQPGVDLNQALVEGTPAVTLIEVLLRKLVAQVGKIEKGPLLIYRNWLDRELRVPWYYALTHPLAGLLFTGILAQSTWRILTGRGVDWSGRNYLQKARK